MMTRFLYRLLAASIICVASVSCGGRLPPGTQCFQLCEQLRPKLINNFGVPPEQIDCSSSKWNLDCAQCYKLFRDEFLFNPGPGTCEAL